MDGASAPGPAFGQSRILIDGDCFKTESPEATYEGVFSIDVDAEPPRIDIEFVEGPEAGESSPGIFRLDGDRLTFCLGLVGSSRPSAFVTTNGSGHALEELRRVSAARPARVLGGKRAEPMEIPAAAAAGKAPLMDTAAFDAQPTSFMKELAGDWKAAEFVRDGQKMQDDWVAYGTRTNTANETKVVFGGQTMLHAKMRIDEKAKPMTVDYLNLAGASKGRLSLGIMERSCDDVTFHVALPGKPRPSDFVSAKGSGTTLSRWRRST